MFFEAGFRPGGRLPFLSRDKKGSKEARPKLPTTLRFAAGDLRWAGCGVCRRTRCALARFAQTTAASQMTKQPCPSAGLPPRIPPNAGVGRRGEAGEQPIPNSRLPEIQNSRCAIVALGCFSWAEADASGLGFGGVAQEIDLVFHVGGQPLGAVLDGAQGVGHHVRVGMVSLSSVRWKPPAPRFEARRRWTRCSKHVQSRADALAGSPIPSVTAGTWAGTHGPMIQT